MLGVLVSIKDLQSGCELLYAYPQAVHYEHSNSFELSRRVKSTRKISEHREAYTESFVFGFPSSVLADLLCPKKELRDKPLDFSIEGLQLISYPVSTDSRQSILTKSFSGELTDDRDSQMLCINVACAIDRDSDFAEKHSEGLSYAVTKLSKSYADLLIQFEHQRTNFLVPEAARLRAMKRDHCLLSEILAESKLAQQLVKAFHSFKDQQDFCLMLNDWLPCRMSLTLPTSASSIKPYQGLLLLESPKR
jgi:hypothetical protein